MRPPPVAPTTQSAPASANAPTPSQALNAPAAAPAQAGFAKGARALVETDVLRATIDANGGDLRQLELLSYRETEDKKQDLSRCLKKRQTAPYLAQSGLVGKNLPTHRSLFQLNPGTYRLTRRSGAAGSPAGVERSCYGRAG